MYRSDHSEVAAGRTVVYVVDLPGGVPLNFATSVPVWKNKTIVREPPTVIWEFHHKIGVGLSPYIPG
jgi:hypothetical protein